MSIGSKFDNKFELKNDLNYPLNPLNQANPFKMPEKEEVVVGDPYAVRMLEPLMGGRPATIHSPAFGPVMPIARPID